jgi:lipopolysaccharide biosynthesis glycosyltransferase
MSFCERDAHIVYASDNKFSEILGVSLVSLYENSRNMDRIHIYILDNGISSENKGKIDSISSNYHREKIQWIKAKDICLELNMNVNIDRGSMSQYSRLLIANELPHDLERVIYLDCDTLILKSIKELWEINLNGKIIGALNDVFSKAYRKNIGLNDMDVMFNSGVLVIDLLLWRSQQIESKLVLFIKSRKGRIQQSDQGALNAILSQDTYCIEPRFNSITVFYDFSYEEVLIYRKPSEFYNREDIACAIDNPTIVHFTTSFLSRRPWVVGCKHKYVAEWKKHKQMSPFSENPEWLFSASNIKRVLDSLYYILPTKVSVYIVGLLHAHIRPTINRVRYR